MKSKAIYFLMIILSVGLISCGDGPANKITITNSALSDVSVNFKGTLTDVPAGSTVELTNILPGEYEYETIYEIPSGATSYEASESCAGTFVLNAGTDILVIYLSTFDGSLYSLSASITTSDNLSEDGILPDPLGP